MSIGQKREMYHQKYVLFDSYDSSMGTFTVLPGGDGFYYFSTYLLGDYDEFGYFNTEINGDLLCWARTDQQQTITDYPQSGCSVTTFAAQGI